jgi:hypothetical protein
LILGIARESHGFVRVAVRSGLTVLHLSLE